MYITTTEELRAFCNLLQDAQFISVDTEFTRKSTYYSELSLIQIAYKNHVAIIDALNTKINLLPLNDIFQNSAIIKVFHSAKQDLEILFTLFGNIPQNIFDTQIAANFCGLGDFISYETLVEKMLNIKIDKTYCISDWTQRPLSKQQLDYAATDVTYLYEIYPRLKEILENKNRLEWMLKEMQTIYKAEHFKINYEQAWKKLKNINNQKINLVTKHLAAWRELKAQQCNLPRNHFMEERILFKLSYTKPISLKEFRKIKQLDKINDQDANEIILVIQNAINKQIELDLNPKDPHIPQINHKMFNELKTLLNSCSKEYSLPASFIATNEDLKELSITNLPLNLSNKVLLGWRKDIIGYLILELYQKPVR